MFVVIHAADTRTGESLFVHRWNYQSREAPDMKKTLDSRKDQPNPSSIGKSLDAIATVRMMKPMRLSLGFQNLGLDIGLDLPWKISSKNLVEGQEDELAAELKPGFEAAAKIIDEVKVAFDPVLERDVRRLAKRMGRG